MIVKSPLTLRLMLIRLRTLQNSALYIAEEMEKLLDLLESRKTEEEKDQILNSLATALEAHLANATEARKSFSEAEEKPSPPTTH